MAELYDQVRQSNSKYVPQFVGSNFDTLKSLGDTLQDRYNKNLDISNALAIQMANDQYLEQDRAIGEKHYNQFSKAIDEIAGSDDSFENSSNIVSQLVKNYGSDRDRIAALDNKKIYEQYISEKQRLGEKALDFTRPENFKGTVNEDGTYNRFSYDVQERLDYDKPKEALFNQIEASYNEGELSQDKNNPEFLQSITRGGISSQDIKNKYLNPAIQRYRGTNEYRQEKRKLQELDGLTSEQADKEIEKSILATGLEKVYGFSKRDSQRHSEFYLSNQGKVLTDNDGSKYELSQSVETKIPIISKTKLGSDPVQTQANNNIIGGLAPINSRSAQTSGKAFNAEKAYTNLDANEKTKFDRILKTFSPETKPNSEEAFKIVNDYIKQVETKEADENTPIIKAAPDTYKPGFDYTAVGASGKSLGQKATDDLKISFNNRVFYNPTTGEKISGSDPKFLKKINEQFDTDFDTVKDFQNAIDIKGEYSPKNRFTVIAGNEAFANPYAAVLNGKDLAVTREASYYNSSDAQKSALVNKAYNAMKELPGIVNNVDIAGINFEIQETPEGRVILRTDNPDFVKEHGKEVSLDDVTQIALFFK